MSKKYNIDELVRDVVALPSLPGTVAHIMRLVTDPNCSLAAVAKAISADPPLTLKTLRLVNTAYYGLRQRVSSIDHAVVLLGTKVVKNLAFTATVFDLMRGSVESFFRHSVTCAVATRVLAEAARGSANQEGAEEAFVCGLLHDIGKVILQQYLPRESEKVAQLSQSWRMPWHVAEMEIIGANHAELGARLAQQWRLPDSLVNGIAGHHDLSVIPAEHYLLASRVAIADSICYACGRGGYDKTFVTLDEAVWPNAGLADSDLGPLVDEFVTHLPLVDELIEIAG